jgi:hypothetical protein
MHRHRSRRCPGYAQLWAGDQRRKLFENLQQAPDTVALLTVTAPGKDVLPWDESVCSGLGGHVHSGKLGCKVQAGAAAEWNGSAAARWRALHRHAYRRASAGRSERPWLLTRVWEMQHRGALHVHPVLAFGTTAQKLATRRYIAALTELAPRYGFGFVDRKLEVMSAKAAAAYLSSYFVTGKGKVTLWESVQHHEMPTSIIHVSTRLTQQTGCTMRRLRLHRFIWTRWRSSPLCEGDTWHELDRYCTSDTGVRLAKPTRGPPSGAPESSPEGTASAATPAG